MAEVSFIQPCLWFDDQAREAMEYYVEVFPNSRILRIDEYPDESLDEHFEGMSGKVLNGQFTLNGVDFVCLDGGPLFSFNESISFVVDVVEGAGLVDIEWYLRGPVTALGETTQRLYVVGRKPS